MAKLDKGARMTIETLKGKRPNTDVADMLGVTEGTIRYHRRRQTEGAVDGRSKQRQLAADYAEPIRFYREQHQEEGVSLTALYEWLVDNYEYPGSKRSVHRYWTRTYPESKQWARRRIETPPGAQAQVDWSEHRRVVIGGREERLYGFQLVLSSSRAPAHIWSRSKHQLAWHSCHIEAFRRLGGVPATVRVDNEKTNVSRGAGAWATINESYRRFARLLRFHVDACPVRHPQAKGKIERLIRTYRFRANPLSMAWDSLEELQAWTDERVEKSTHMRRSPSTGTSIHEAWRRERELLTPLPEPLWKPFDLVATRRVGPDCLISFDAREYSVPFAYVGQAVEAHGCAETVQIFADGRIVAEHPRHTPELIVIDPAHYDGESTDRVRAPMPLGKMGRRMLELAAEPVAYRSIDYYHQLAEVAR